MIIALIHLMVLGDCIRAFWHLDHAFYHLQYFYAHIGLLYGIKYNWNNMGITLFGTYSKLGPLLM